MDRKQFAQFAMALKTYYPRENILPNEQSMQLWYGHLKKIPYEVIELALQRWVDNNKWSPSIADIRAESKSIYWKLLETKTGNEALDIYEAITRMEREEKEIPVNLELKMLEVKT